MPFHQNESVGIIGKLAIVGVGLIGGSIAAAVRQRFPETTVIGIGRNADRLKAAVDGNVLTAFDTDPAAAAEADIVIACTPVDRIASDLRALTGLCRPDAVLTDAGSVKGVLCESLADLPRFVGSHPLAGSEKTGWENADADLFQDRTCIVTPIESTSNDLTDRVTSFWRSLGMNVITMSPEAHDLAVAETSHLPHIAAAAVARQLSSSHESLIASGFRDTTRVASGHAGMWTAILESNRTAISEQLGIVIDDLAALRSAIDAGDLETIERWLSEAADVRTRLQTP